MNPTFERATLLYDQGRYADAEREFRATLAQEPRDALAHALLALCLLERRAPDARVYAEATAEANQAVGIAPAEPYCHYVRARVLMARNLYSDAEAAIGEALRIDGYNANYFWLLGAIRFEIDRPAEALRAAEQGLAINARHQGCINLRAMALVRLGRQDEAGAAIDAALAENPHSSVTHANRGWTLLHEGNPRKALEHFREALRIDPENDWAKSGMVEALKARNPLYRMMLAYFLWMSRIGPRLQWFVIIGALVGQQLLSSAAQTNPSIRPYILPITYGYIGFVLLTWLSSPLFNLFLGVNRFGRYLLTTKQRAQGYAVGALLAAGIVTLVLTFTTGPIVLLLLAIVLILLTMPVSGTFTVPAGWPLSVMIGATAIIAAAGFTWFGTELIVDQDSGSAAASLEHLSSLARPVFTYGILITTLGINYLRNVRLPA